MHEIGYYLLSCMLIKHVLSELGIVTLQITPLY